MDDIMQTGYEYVNKAVYRMSVEIANLYDKEVLKKVREYAKAQGINDVTVIDDKALMQVLIRGFETCKKIYGDDFVLAERFAADR